MHRGVSALFDPEVLPQMCVFLWSMLQTWPACHACMVFMCISACLLMLIHDSFDAREFACFRISPSSMHVYVSEHTFSCFFMRSWMCAFLLSSASWISCLRLSSASSLRACTSPAFGHVVMTLTNSLAAEQSGCFQHAVLQTRQWEWRRSAAYPQT